MESANQLAQAPIWERISCSGIDCTACNFTQGVNVVIEFLIYASGVAAIILFSYAGFLYLGAGLKSSNIEKAKRIFIETAKGFAVVLAAFLIVDVIMKTFMSNDIRQDIGPWNAIICPDGIQSGGDNGAFGGRGGDGSGGDTNDVPRNSEFANLDQCTREYAATKGVRVKDNLCSDYGQSGCTSVAGLPKSVLDHLGEFRESCGCEVFISGGTEGGHQTHGPGVGRVDLRMNPRLQDYIMRNGRYLGQNDNKERMFELGGHVFTNEGSHFHVRYRGIDETPYSCNA